MAFRCHREVLGGKLHDRVVLGVHLLVALVEEHLHATINQYYTEDRQQPGELADESR